MFQVATQSTAPARVLACLNVGSTAEEILTEERRQALAHTAELHVLHIEQPGTSTRCSLADSDRTAALLHRAQCLGAQIHVVQSYQPDQAILESFKEIKPLLVVIGTQHATGLKRLFATDVAAVLRHKGVPIMVI
jgi:K+-sensing histidine kinase KdpD